MKKSPTQNSRLNDRLGSSTRSTAVSVMPRSTTLLDFDWSIDSSIQKLLHGGIGRGAEFIGYALRNHLSFEQHRYFVRYLKYLRKLVANHHSREAPQVAARFNQIVHLLTDERIEAGVRFVDQQHLRLRDQS